MVRGDQSAAASPGATECRAVRLDGLVIAAQREQRVVEDGVAGDWPGSIAIRAPMAGARRYEGEFYKVDIPAIRFRTGGCLLPHPPSYFPGVNH